MADNLPDVYLRFLESGGSSPKPLFEGDSMDAAYPGKGDGWITITDFEFGFGWGGSDTSAGVTKAVNKEKDPDSRLKALEDQQKTLQSQVKSGEKPGAKGAAPKKEEGTLKPKEVSFSRTPSAASTSLMKFCRRVEEIPFVELVACRAAGVDFSMGKKDVKQIAKDAKIPFVRFIFEKVYLIKSQLSVSTAPVPSETIEFIFQKVQMETVWTDNETGQRVTGGTNRVWYDFGNKEKDAGGLKVGDDD